LNEAAESYRRVLALRSDDAAAKANLDLCEKLLAENGGAADLTAPLKNKLLDAMLAQKRQADAVPLSRELKRDTETAEVAIKSRLKAVMAQPGWKPDGLKSLPDGTFSLDLRWVKVPDLAILDKLPISKLTLDASTDFAPLHQLPLQKLSLRGVKDGTLEALRGLKLTSLDLTGSDYSDLSPVAGMPLDSVDLTGASKISDLTPLRGMPLKILWLSQTKVRSLEPLRGMPLEFLSMIETPVTSLEPLRGSPLTELKAEKCVALTDISPLSGLPLKALNLNGCHQIADLAPLAGCKTLENLLLPTHTSDVAALRQLPNLKRLSNRAWGTYNQSWNTVPAAADFWKKNGDRLARQVPMEKQLEKFRQSLVAQGNDQEKVPRYFFDADGQLSIDLWKELKVSDISGLRGVAVTKFVAYSSSLRDLSPLAGAPLKQLTLFTPCGVTDLSPLRDAPLEMLYLDVIPVRDISAVRTMPLKMAYLKDCPIADVSPLADVRTLETVRLPWGAKNVETLRNHPKISMISYEWDTKLQRPKRTAVEFWKEFDARKAAAPK
jgi:hypothetical protein